MDSNEEISDEDFIRLAEENQIYYYDSLGSRMWDDIAKSDIYLLKQKIGYATYGRSEEIPDKSNYFTGHNIKNLEKITEIANQIIAVSDYDPIRFACIFLTIYYDKKISNVPVFRIHNNRGENIFIDFDKRVYNNWNEFVENNQLPECKYCHPSEGIYFGSETSFQFQESPACKLLNKAANYTDIAASATGLGGAFAAMFIASPVILPVMATVGTYSVGRSIYSLYDRSNHKQSLNISDKDARGAYINIGSSLVGIGAAGAVTTAKKLVEGGQVLSKYAGIGLKVLNTSSLIISGFGFVDTFFSCCEKFNEGTLTPQDIFNLSCEIIFFCNAVSSAKATHTMLNKMSEINVVRNSKNNMVLTKSQKRNFKRKVSKMKTRLSNEMKGTSTNINLEFLFKIGSSILLGYSPCVEAKLFKYRSIGHSILCFIKKEIGFKELIKSVLPMFSEFSKDILEDIKYAVTTVRKYFASFKDFIISLFDRALPNKIQQFSLLVKNINSRIESAIESNQITEIMTENEENEGDESMVENNEEVIPEVFKLVNGVADITRSHSNLFPCENLDEFNNILKEFTDELLKNYSDEIDKYKKSVKAAKFTNTNFDVTKFNEILGYGSNPFLFLFNEELKKMNKISFLTPVLKKCKAKPRNLICTDILPDNTNMRMFSEMGELTKEQIYKNVVNKVEMEESGEYRLKFITEEDGRTMGLEGDVVNFGFFYLINDKKEDHIVVFYHYHENITTGYIFFY
uniref:DUF4781 domain-containing protein n=1 Tax=Clastoptera arizonana TaxID=38151 RepID=A0A1B6C5H3_9HEMI